MKRALTILLTILLTGCGLREYQHNIYSAQGTQVESYHVVIIDNLFDSKSSTATLTLPDKTTLTINGSTNAPDPNALAAIQGIANAVITAGTVALKLVGVP